MSAARVAGALALVIGGGCFSEPMSLGTQGSTGSSSGDTSSGAVEGSSGSTSSGDGDSAGVEATGAPDDTSSPTTDGSMSSTTDGECVPLRPTLMWAEDADLLFPMELEDAVLLPGVPMLARSYVEDAGTITFVFELPCATSIQIHALVWDPLQGVQDADPDSYVVSVDGGREIVWTFGCGSADVPDATWQWQRVAESIRSQCDAQPLDVELEAGPHQIVLRNREPGAGLVYAAIAAVVVSDDPAFDPSTLYATEP